MILKRVKTLYKDIDFKEGEFRIFVRRLGEYTSETVKGYVFTYNKIEYGVYKPKYSDYYKITHLESGMCCSTFADKLLGFEDVRRIMPKIDKWMNEHKTLVNDAVCKFKNYVRR